MRYLKNNAENVCKLGINRVSSLSPQKNQSILTRSLGKLLSWIRDFTAFTNHPLSLYVSARLLFMVMFVMSAAQKLVGIHESAFSIRTETSNHVTIQLVENRNGWISR